MHIAGYSAVTRACRDTAARAAHSHALNGKTGATASDAVAARAQTMATQTLVLQGESELRLEVDFDKIVVVTVKEGIAEVLGLELAQGKEYAFAGAKVAIYTWFGARVEVVGEATSCYATGRGETTQHATLNAHSYLETRRDEAARKVSEAIAGASYKACDAGLSIAKGDKAPPTGDASALSGVCADYQKACAPTKDCRGPRVLVCGPTDSGKSTLCATLCAYAARLGREPLFVDLDPGLGDCGAPPGAIAACRVVREHATVQEGCVGGVDDAPLAFWLGRTEPQDHGELYDHVVEQLAKACAERLHADRNLDLSGLIINTSGWVDGDGFQSLLRMCSAFSVDCVLVLAHDRLFADLRAALPRTVAVAKLARSGGVVQRDPAHRRRARNKKVHEYFYGPQSHVRGLSKRGDDAADLEKMWPPLAPSTHELPFRDCKVYQIMAGAVRDDAMLPVGQASLLEALQVVAVPVSAALVHTVLAVCHVDDAEEAPASSTTSPHQHLLDRAAGGFVVVINVDMDAQTITLLAPCSGELPSCHLLMGTLEWMESSFT